MYNYTFSYIYISLICVLWQVDVVLGWSFRNSKHDTIREEIGNMLQLLLGLVVAGNYKQVYICLHIHECIHTCMSLYTYTCVWLWREIANRYISVYIYICTYIHISICERIGDFSCCWDWLWREITIRYMFVQVYICICIHVCIYIRI